MPDAFFLGPLAVPLAMVAIMAGLLAGSFVLHFVLPGIAHRETVSWLSGRSHTALIAGLLVWKVWPVFQWWDAIVARPVILLRLPGGTPGTIAAVLTAIAVFLPGLYRVPARIRPAGMYLSAVALPIVFLLAAFSIMANSGPGSDVSEDVRTVIREWEFLPGTTPQPASHRLGEDVLFAGPVVLGFWASWCGPCVAELPVKEEFHRRYGDSIHYIAINMTRTEQSVAHVAQFVEREMMPYPIALDRDGSATAAFGVRGTPTTIVIDRYGRIQDRWLGPSSLDRLERAVRLLVQ